MSLYNYTYTNQPFQSQSLCSRKSLIENFFFRIRFMSMHINSWTFLLQNKITKKVNKTITRILRILSAFAFETFS